MSFALFLGVCLAGGLGAAVRMLLDGLLKSAVAAGSAPLRGWAAFPWATGVINVTGSFLLGLVTGLALGGLVSPVWQAVLGTGFLGGYTTFSTAMVETVRLVQGRRWGLAAANLLGVIGLGVLAAWGGMLLGLHP